MQDIDNAAVILVYPPVFHTCLTDVDVERILPHHTPVLDFEGIHPDIIVVTLR